MEVPFFRGKREFKIPRTIAEIPPITVDFSTRPWDAQGAPLHSQLTTAPFTGEGLLMRASTEQLKAIFTAVVKEQGSRPQNPWTADQQRLVLEIAQFVEKKHQKQTRGDKRTPYLHHLLRTASRSAQLEIGNPYMVAVALLHDAPEDQNVTLEEMIQHFVFEQGHDFNTVNMLFEGANALNNQRGGKKLSQKQYFTDINTTNQQYPDLHLWAIKGLDRLDNFISDLSPALRHQALDDSSKIRRVDAEQIKDTLDNKILPVVGAIARNEASSGVITLMAEATRLGLELMAEHGLTINKGFVGNTNRQGRRILNRAPG